MSDNSRDKLDQALAALEHALSFEGKVKTDAFYFGGIAKAFETAIEYAWKYFRGEAINAGFEVASPREAIKLAATIGIIDELDLWLGFLKTRNIAVHDYIGLPQDEYLEQIKLFATCAKKIKAPV
jgi:nucleotidyltransferase substrate binding protein (TIGR01987 family)